EFRTTGTDVRLARRGHARCGPPTPGVHDSRRLVARAALRPPRTLSPVHDRRIPGAGAVARPQDARLPRAAVEWAQARLAGAGGARRGAGGDRLGDPRAAGPGLETQSGGNRGVATAAGGVGAAAGSAPSTATLPQKPDRVPWSIGATATPVKF